MKRKGNLFQILGIALILLSGALLLGSQALARHRSTQAKALAQQIEAQLPSRRAGTPEDYSDPAMPVWQLQGENFLGLVEVSLLRCDSPHTQSLGGQQVIFLSLPLLGQHL